MVAFANSQCIMDACLFLNNPERVPFQFTMASGVVYIYFPSCCKGRAKFSFFTKKGRGLLSGCWRVAAGA